MGGVGKKSNKLDEEDNLGEETLEEEEEEEDSWPGPATFWIMTTILVTVIMLELYVIQDRQKQRMSWYWETAGRSSGSTILRRR